MTGAADLRALLDKLEDVQRRLGEVSRRSDAERAGDLVQGRRALSTTLHEIMLAGDAVFAGSDDKELLREFRHRFSAMRAAAAALQADWPAVRVRDQGGADYAAAVARVREGDRACIAWTRAVLDARNGGAA